MAPTTIPIHPEAGPKIHTAGHKLPRARDKVGSSNILRDPFWRDIIASSLKQTLYLRCRDSIPHPTRLTLLPPQQRCMYIQTKAFMPAGPPTFSLTIICAVLQRNASERNGHKILCLQPNPKSNLAPLLLYTRAPFCTQPVLGKHSPNGRKNI